MKRLLTVLAFMAVTLAGTAIPAFAHNVLVDSDPKAGSQLASGPAQATLTFDQPIQPGDFDVITVTGPNGTRWEDSSATVQGVTISAKIRPLGPVGDYTIGYRILSADGHPVSGSVKFSTSKAGSGTPLPAASIANEPAAQQGDGLPIWPWIAGGAVLLVVGLVIALRLGGGDRETPSAGSPRSSTDQ